MAGSAINNVSSTVNGVTYTDFSRLLTLNMLGTLGTNSITIGQSGTVTLDNTAINIPNSGSTFGRFTNGTSPRLRT